MNRRISFIIQTARLADEIGWLEHDAELSRIAHADIADQSETLRLLAQRINALADRLAAPIKLKEVA